jgi:F0F1-type ATP synthase assembly protein I
MADDVPGQGLRGRDLIGLGGLLAGAVIAGLVVGLLIDDRAGTSPVFTLIGVFTGMVSGALGFWVRVRDALRD